MSRETSPNYPPDGSQRLKKDQPKGLPPQHAVIEHLDNQGRVTAETIAYMNEDMRKALGLQPKQRFKLVA